ncbi:hypothetical protein RRG08_051205 [Elysia crispata]|uniref:Uncharacterized protein n=1 Tax=Elysia crispata TaxID=231223 RepID=A0AAE0Z6B0_9GAST|nr:hypothetical protein RRG08_051205 [Elysia crispata]
MKRRYTLSHRISELWEVRLEHDNRETEGIRTKKPQLMFLSADTVGFGQPPDTEGSGSPDHGVCCQEKDPASLQATVITAAEMGRASSDVDSNLK